MLKVPLNEQFFGRNQVPFVDQLQGVDESLVENEYGKTLDLAAAKRFGAPLLQFFSFWGWRACGIANVAMILKKEFGESPTLYELTGEGVRLNGYAFRNRYGKTDIGWKHRILCQLLKNRGLNAMEVHRLDLKKIAKLVRDSKYVIASVRSARGGHLVLITGLIQDSAGGIKVVAHDPYTFKGQGGAGIVLNASEFREVSLGKGIVVWGRTSCSCGKRGVSDGLPELSAVGMEKTKDSQP